MLRLSALIAVLIAFAPAVAAQSVSDSALVARIYDDLARGDVSAVTAVLDDHVLWIEDADSARAKRHFGPSTVAVRVLQPQVAARATDLPETIASAHGRVVAIGTNRWLDPVTGQVRIARFYHVWQVDDGRVVGVERSTRFPANAPAIEDDTANF
jgi:ketosteroid isomerase-like protein